MQTDVRQSQRTTPKVLRHPGPGWRKTSGAVFCDWQAQQIERRILTLPKAKAILEHWDEEARLAGPWNSVYKLQAVLHRAKSTEAIEWTIAQVSDAIRMRYLEVGAVTVQSLRKELVPLALLKLQAKSWFLDTFLPKLQLSREAKKAIAENCQDHEAVRHKLTGYPDEAPSEMSWVTEHGPGCTKLLEFLEGVVYGQTYDTTLKTAVRHSKEWDVVLEYPSFVEDRRRQWPRQGLPGGPAGGLAAGAVGSAVGVGPGSRALASPRGVSDGVSCRVPRASNKSDFLTHGGRRSLPWPPCVLSRPRGVSLKQC